MKKRRKYTAKQKAQIVLELMKEEISMAQISSEYGVHPNQLYRWKKQGSVQFHEVFEGRQKEIRQLEQKHQKKVANFTPRLADRPTRSIGSNTEGYTA